MSEIHLITVGKLNDKNIEILELDYTKRIGLFKFQIHEVKSHSEDLTKESKEVVKKIQDIGKAQSRKIILLEEKGNLYNSPDFAKAIQNDLDRFDPLIFVIGGASGHGAEIKSMAKGSISLSPLTYPHKLARLLFVEQIYRAETILKGHPYHK